MQSAQREKVLKLKLFADQGRREAQESARRLAQTSAKKTKVQPEAKKKIVILKRKAEVKTAQQVKQVDNDITEESDESEVLIKSREKSKEQVMAQF